MCVYFRSPNLTARFPSLIMIAYAALCLLLHSASACRSLVKSEPSVFGPRRFHTEQSTIIILLRVIIHVRDHATYSASSFLPSRALPNLDGSLSSVNVPAVRKFRKLHSENPMLTELTRPLRSSSFPNLIRSVLVLVQGVPQSVSILTPPLSMAWVDGSGS